MFAMFGMFADSAAIADEGLRPRVPNILVAIADDWSFGHAGAYGCPWVRTPAFDRVAREGILFQNAYTPNAKCAPSRACLLTGRNSWQLDAACNHICFFPERFATYVDSLRSHGYFAGATAKGWGPGVANDASGAPRAMTGSMHNARKAKPPSSGIANNDYAANFREFLDAAPTDRPWCFWYGALEPHRGYEYQSGIRKGGKKPQDIPRVPAYWPDNETVRTDMLDYAFEVEHFDEHLGRMLAILEERGQLANTLVVVTSDHGMPFPRVKGQAYDASNHVPLAVRWPEGIREPGRRVVEFVSLIDLAPTFLDVAGISSSESGMQPITGRSLRDLFAEPIGSDSPPDPARDHVLIGKERHDVGRPADQGYPIRGIVQGDWLYLRNYEPDRWPACNPETGYLNCDGGPTKTEVLTLRRTGTDVESWRRCFGKRVAEELYHLKQDPDCLVDLSTDPRFASRKVELASRMIGELTEQLDPRMDGRGGVFEAFPYANEETRGFYERYLRGEKVRAGWVSPTDFEPGPIVP
ncbi:MAG: sulfatase [Planctomycetes bacterium]|nr:sulfatase [Planctomycetota bacterium]